MKLRSRAFLIFLTFCIFSCAHTPLVVEQAEPAEVTEQEEMAPEIEIEIETPIVELAPEPEVPELPREDYITIVAAGDNLYHSVMIRDGEEGDYESIYEEIRSLVEQADIAFINQETLLAGGEFGFSGYPRFNTPQEAGRAIATLGFNVINHASNHVMDKGEDAILATLDFWDSIEQVQVLGIHRSEEERELPVLVEKNNITIGLLGYTYGTNGIPVPGEKPYLVSLIDTEIMEREIDALRPLCDVLVLSLHWGEEYSHDKNNEQEDLAAFCAEHRVDLVLGHHPHVIQPIEHITRPDGGVTLCYYSLGNLISAQTQLHTLLGALAYIRIKKTFDTETEESAIEFTDAGAIPLVSHFENGFTGFRVYPLHDYTEELMKEHWIKEALTLDQLKELSAKYLMDKEMLYNPFESETVMPEPDLYQ